MIFGVVLDYVIYYTLKKIFNTNSKDIIVSFRSVFNLNSSVIFS